MTAPPIIAFSCRCRFRLRVRFSEPPYWWTHSRGTAFGNTVLRRFRSAQHQSGHIDIAVNLNIPALDFTLIRPHWRTSSEDKANYQAQSPSYYHNHFVIPPGYIFFSRPIRTACKISAFYNAWNFACTTFCAITLQTIRSALCAIFEAVQNELYVFRLAAFRLRKSPDCFMIFVSPDFPW